MTEPPRRPRARFGPLERRLLVASLAVLFLVVQLLPLGSPRSNPSETGAPAWDSPRTAELFDRTCADCHSNRTRWPWYSRVAPVSWLVTSDVAGGREHLNVSEWDRPQRHADEAAGELRERKMPLRSYLLTHPEARLTDAERQELIAGLVATFGEEPPRERGRGRGRGGEAAR
jgi:mono/diheme cytochrome c family protein